MQISTCILYCWKRKEKYQSLQLYFPVISHAFYQFYNKIAGVGLRFFFGLESASAPAPLFFFPYFRFLKIQLIFFKGRVGVCVSEINVKIQQFSFLLLCIFSVVWQLLRHNFFPVLLLPNISLFLDISY